MHVLSVPQLLFQRLNHNWEKQTVDCIALLQSAIVAYT